MNDYYDIETLLLLCKNEEDKILIYCINEKTNKDLQILLNKTREQIKDKLKQKEDYGFIPNGYIIESGKRGKEVLYKSTEKAYKIFDNWLLQEEIKKQKAFEEEQDKKRIEQKIEYIKDFIDDYYEDKKQQKELIRIDFMNLAKFDPSLAIEVLEYFSDSINYFISAFKDYNNLFDNIISFYNIPKTEMVKISSLDYKNYDKLVMIEGLIRSRSERKSKVTIDEYECKNCGNSLFLHQKDKYMVYPKYKCSECEEKSWYLKNRNMVTIQRLEVEEFSEHLDGVNEPRCVNVLLINDLCKPEFQKHFNPGTRIKFWGVLKSEESYINNRKKVLLDHYIEVNGFEVLEQSLEFNVTQKEQDKIIELSKREDIIDLLTNSFATEIFGNKLCKLSLLLCAVKGYIQKPKWKRDRIHVMFVGNPGSGKTIMIKKLIELTKLSRFASGLNSSKVGLMAAVVQDTFVGGYKLSAGAVALANNGICAIDEFDKIPDEDKKALNSAMEEGEIIVDKASIHQKLMANTTIVSSCNPKDERFQEKDQYYKQYNLPKSLIDRFDLIFVVNADAYDNPFTDIIKEVDFEVIDEDLLSKYIIMAQNHNPKIDKEILKYLAKKGCEFKKEWKQFNFIFGFRQFNSVRNIAYALGRLKLIKEITIKEVDEAFNLYKSSVESQQYQIL